MSDVKLYRTYDIILMSVDENDTKAIEDWKRIKFQIIPNELRNSDESVIRNYFINKRRKVNHE